MTILRRVLKEYDVRVWTESIWLRTGTTGGLACTRFQWRREIWL